MDKSFILKYASLMVVVCSLFLGGCAGSSKKPEEPSAKQSSRKVATRTSSHAFVTARLEGSSVTVQISPSLTDEYSEYATQPIDYSRIYTVAGIRCPVKDVFVGSVGQDVFPYILLVCDNGSAEYVNVMEGIGDDFTFTSSGRLSGLSGIKQFEQGTVQDDEGISYVTIFAHTERGERIDVSEILDEGGAE